MAHDPVGKRNRRRAMLGMTGAALAAGAAGAISGGRRATAGRDDPAIVGAWLVRWRGATRQHLRTWAFLPGGVALEFDAPVDTTTDPTDAENTLEYGAAGLGQWVQTGFHDFAFTVLEIKYDDRANPTSIVKLTGTVTLDVVGGTWQGTRTLE
ncbi:MAG: hypothetical protein AB7U18_19415, partial [Dehalococcoidia bacterium]